MGGRVYCPFCGEALWCPVPVPELAVCHRCGTQIELRRLFETAVFPSRGPVARVETGVVEAEVADVAEVVETVEPPVPPAVRRAGLSLIIAGVLAVTFAGVSGMWTTEAVRSVSSSTDTKAVAAAALGFSLLNTVCGVLIAAGGVYAVGMGATTWAYIGAALTLLPTGCCCIALAPFGIFALVNLLAEGHY